MQTDVYHNILRTYWGYTAFRPLQETIIRSVCAGKDTLGLMPTGGGKSITFQVPVMTMEGICLVVTPLIALMRDQTENLHQVGIAATAIHSEMSREEIVGKLNGCIAGKYKFLYLSPERLENPLFLGKLQAMNVCLLVVDECHCISQWGYDFRPAYLWVATLRGEFPHVPVLALTATATPEVADDIQNKLLFREKNVLRESFFRPNLAYLIRRTENKQGTLIHLLKQTPGSAIVYTRSRKLTEETALILKQNDISADFFHAGLARKEKETRQSRWKTGNCRVIVATNAFGMGIDKPDVRLVIHLNMPGSLEEYFQEAGRAGRDGEKASAVALCSSTERDRLEQQLHNAFPEKREVRQVYEALCNHYHLAKGEGENRSFAFQSEIFCAACLSLHPIQVHHALKLLELSGYISYREEREEDEQTACSQITFLTHRIETRSLSIPPSAYEERRKRAEKRIRKVVEYITRDNICRSRLLSDYFGERNTIACGCCDVCLSSHQPALNERTFNDIRSRLETLLTARSPLSVRSLTECLPFSVETSLAVIRLLIDNDERFRMKDDKLFLA